MFDFLPKINLYFSFRAETYFFIVVCLYDDVGNFILWIQTLITVFDSFNVTFQRESTLSIFNSLYLKQIHVFNFVQLIEVILSFWRRRRSLKIAEWRKPGQSKMQITCKFFYFPSNVMPNKIDEKNLAFSLENLF